MHDGRRAPVGARLALHAARRWGQGHFFEVLRRISWPYPVLFMEDVPYPNNTCFK
jgi:hypothetical protein